MPRPSSNLLHTTSLLLFAVPLLFWLRSHNAGDYLLLDTPSRNHTLYVECGALCYYNTIPTAPNPWNLRYDHAREIRYYDASLNYTRPGLFAPALFERSPDLHIRLPLWPFLLAAFPLPLYWTLRHGLPHSPRAARLAALCFAGWPILLGLLMRATEVGVYLVALSAIPALTLLLLRDAIRYAYVTRTAPWPWQLTALRRYHRAHAGLCATCGYDLRHSPQRCPECGTHLYVTQRFKLGRLHPPTH